ncbi:methyltransferase [Pseudogemmobacter bohemicus]|uniref:methyltransferase n=1 Tax=Pseudogemmobacter bohemicus TaxID=2250708 RepID=UPI0013009208|nr:methyltransferase [Pseudogemmobacter bohemicus]
MTAGHSFRSPGHSCPDQHDYGAGYPVQDYLFGPPPAKVLYKITNQPFRLAEKFIVRALESSLDGVAMLVRTSFLEGQSRYASLFKKQPPTHVLQFAERVIMHKGKMLDPDVPVRTWSKKLGEWVMRKPSTATSYCWLVWIRNSSGPSRIIWIPPCRKQLTKPGDYLLPEVLAA